MARGLLSALLSAAGDQANVYIKQEQEDIAYDNKIKRDTEAYKLRLKMEEEKMLRVENRKQELADKEKVRKVGLLNSYLGQADKDMEPMYDDYAADKGTPRSMSEARKMAILGGDTDVADMIEKAMSDPTLDDQEKQANIKKAVAEAQKAGDKTFLASPGQEIVSDDGEVRYTNKNVVRKESYVNQSGGSGGGSGKRMSESEITRLFSKASGEIDKEGNLVRGKSKFNKAAYERFIAEYGEPTMENYLAWKNKKPVSKTSSSSAKYQYVPGKGIVAK